MDEEGYIFYGSCQIILTKHLGIRHVSLSQVNFMTSVRGAEKQPLLSSFYLA
jgi:hypothetical protein